MLYSFLMLSHSPGYQLWIVDENDVEYFIDEIAKELEKHTSVHLPFITIYRKLIEKMNPVT